MTNEQKYKTPEERIKAFYDFCKGQGDRCNHCEIAKKRLSISRRSECAVYWLAIEAKDKPEPCPFCNGETEIVSCNGGIQVRCTHCGYTSEGYREGKENEAIAAHNRVCRAVEAVKKGDVK